MSDYMGIGKDVFSIYLLCTKYNIYGYFQVNRPRGRGTAMLIGVNLS
ncbi:hypothetical protein [Nostoc sp. NMS7]|nr:hypothetical protein [Nostoc sp. NMS7]